MVQSCGWAGDQFPLQESRRKIANCKDQKLFSVYVHAIERASMNFQRFSRYQTNIMVFCVFGLFLMTKFIKVFQKDIAQGIAYWAYTDWLIDYSSGFVRRGLSGEFIDLVSNYIHPQILVAILAWIIFLSVVFGYVRLLSRSIKTLPTFLFAALLFLPGLLPFYLYEHDAFGRKEIVGYLILLYHLYVLESVKTIPQNDPSLRNSYIKKILPLTFLFIPIHILIHESSFLLFLPFHILITYTILRLRFPGGFAATIWPDPDLPARACDVRGGFFLGET